jgi:POTRA domain, FtsQ-type
MSPSASISAPARTWRDIPQSITPRAMSSTGRKRMMMATTKSVAVLVFACVCLWAGYEVYATWQQNPAKLKAPVKSSPVKNIVLRTDGVLDQPWVVRALALPKDADLMELDLFALRGRLADSGQIRTAVLSRKFPDTLVVAIEERSAVARINARFGEGDPETFLVARDGVVFRGACFKDEVVQSLPFLGGVALKRAGGKLLPIEGMNVVADLLGTARVNAPNLYRSWTVVSLEKLLSDGQIIARSAEVGEVVFGTRDDFYKQIARLDFILDEAKKNPAPSPVKSINLAVGGDQVPVLFETPTVETPDQKSPGAAKLSSPTARMAVARTHNVRAQPTRPGQSNSPRISSRRDI